MVVVEKLAAAILTNGLLIRDSKSHFTTLAFFSCEIEMCLAKSLAPMFAWMKSCTVSAGGVGAYSVFLA